MGLVLMGPLVPRILDDFALDGWRYSWVVLGALVLVLSIVAVAIGLTGHFGGTLVFGPDYYVW